MVLEEGGPCACGATESHKWYGGKRKPARCKHCYEEQVKEALKQAPVLGKRTMLQADYFENYAEVAEGKMVWEIHEVLGIRCVDP